MDASGYPSRSYAWTVVAILFATAILAYTDRQVLSLLVDPIRADLHITDTQVSLLLGTAFAVVYGFAGIPLGLLVDRTSRRNLLVAGVLVWSVGTLACSVSHSFAQLFAARIVVGLGEAVLSPAAISLISDYFPPARRGTAVGCFLSGIATGIGTALLIGGGVLHLVESGALSGTPFATQPPWRLVLLVIGGPGLLWTLAILAIKEPIRQTGDTAAHEASATAAASGDSSHTRSAGTAGARTWVHVAPIFLVVAIASLVDNAVGAWAPTLLMREFSRSAANVSVVLGLPVTAGFGGGVLLGGWLSDRAGAGGGKLKVCVGAGVLLLPVALLISSAQFNVVTVAVALYFALSGIVTACGFSAILDVVPNRSRGLAMAVSFFLNVALGAGLGPTAVALISEHAGLGSAITITVAGCYGLAVVTLLATLSLARTQATASG